MFLCTLSVLVSVVMANSSAQRGRTEAAVELRVARDRYSVPQDIRDQVPADFAAMNLRKSRLKIQTDRSPPRHRAIVNKAPKAPINRTKRPSARKNASKQSRYAKQKGPARKKSTANKPGATAKPPRFRMAKFSPTTLRPTIHPLRYAEEVPIESSNFDNNTFSSQSQKPISPNAYKQENNFANIKKAINSLPQQTVKIVRDDIDCNDDPAKIFQNTRGPPCTFSLRWPGTGGHPSFWLNKVYPQNWELFY